MSRVVRRLAAIALTLGLAHPAMAQTTVRYVHTDALGSVVAMTDENRVVVERREYEPYGQQLTALEDGPGYTGHVQDAASGLTYMQQRYYDSEIGLFLSVDPVMPIADMTTQFNRYRYANDNPYHFVDPDGRKANEIKKFVYTGPIPNTCSRGGGSACTGSFEFGTSSLAVQADTSRKRNENIKQPMIDDAEPSLNGVRPLVSCNQTDTCLSVDQVRRDDKYLVGLVATPPGIIVALRNGGSAAMMLVNTKRGRELMFSACYGAGLCQGKFDAKLPKTIRAAHTALLNESRKGALSEAARIEKALVNPL